eukprot:g49337.t1
MFLFVLATILASVHGCTAVIITKGASADGSNIVAHTEDAGGGTSDLRVTYIPPAAHPPGSKRPVYRTVQGYPRVVSMDKGPAYMPVGNQKVWEPIGYVDQVESTYGYWAAHYGLANDQGLAIGESTTDARTVGWAVGDQGPHGKNMLNIVELSWIALERCATVRCAVQTMGDLAEKYGFFSEDSNTWQYPGFTDSAEALGLCDKKECWAFIVATGLNNFGAIWAAQRIPDGEVAIIPNAIPIRFLNLSDTDNYLASSNVLDVARKQGWWDPNTPFDFKAAYGYDSPDIDDEEIVSLYGGRRAWRFFDLLAPSLKLDPGLGLGNRVPTYPLSLKPDGPVSVQQVMSIMRDYYQGTPFDLSKGNAAGPFEDPVRYETDPQGLKGSWERSIYIYRNVFSHVIQVRDLPNELATVIWYGHDTSLCTVYTPFYA